MDRTGPETIVTENIPEYTSETSFAINFDFSDNYTIKEEIRAFYKTNITSEKEIVLENYAGIIELPEGVLQLEIYSKDNLDNIGNIYTKNLTVDITNPEIKINLSNTSKIEEDIKQRIELMFIINSFSSKNLANAKNF